jgi:hypothetical protein
MRGQYCQGYFNPLNPKKYKGNVKSIFYRSSWEMKAMKYFDSNENILEWANEEMCIPYISPVDNLYHKYFPDFIVKAKTKEGPKIFMVEVKPETQIQAPKPRKKVTTRFLNEVATYAVNQAKWNSAKEFCAKKGWEFMTLNEYDLGIKKSSSQ